MHLAEFANDEQSPRTVYVGGLSPAVSEELILTLFGQIGPVSKSKLINDVSSFLLRHSNIDNNIDDDHSQGFASLY